MSKRHLLVTALVAALCTGILVLFTEIERSVPHWLHCGGRVSRQSPDPICRR